MPNPPMYKNHYPIETEMAYKFWGSRHICNRMKAIVAFSTSIEDAKYNLRRHGYPYHFRIRALNAYQNHVAQPDMDNMVLTPLGVPWWECMPSSPLPPPKPGRWILWQDRVAWEENRGDDWDNWVEWMADEDLPPLPVQPKP